jgi:HAD superfamily hydrolase (TIGR01549 family)
MIEKFKMKAIIWDMDGVISDTQKLHAQVESELLARYKINLSPETITKRYAGLRTADFFQELLNDKGIIDYDVRELMKEKWEKVTSLVPQVQSIPGAINLIKQAYCRNVPQAVASGSGRDYINGILKKLNILKYFQVIVSGDDIQNGKPSPEIFLKAASCLNIKPNECVVIEDGVNGMAGAKESGMKCIGLYLNHLSFPIDKQVSSLDELNIEEILK